MKTVDKGFFLWKVLGYVSKKRQSPGKGSRVPCQVETFGSQQEVSGGFSSSSVKSSASQMSLDQAHISYGLYKNKWTEDSPSPKACKYCSAKRLAKTLGIRFRGIGFISFQEHGVTHTCFCTHRSREHGSIVFETRSSYYTDEDIGEEDSKLKVHSLKEDSL